MKQVLWLIARPLAVVLPVCLFLFFTSTHSSQIREEGQSAIYEAVARMEKVAATGSMSELIAACRAGDEKIDCRQLDYDISYRGHRILASEIAVDYYSVTHNKWDVAHQKYIPYMTATVHLEREPRLQYNGWIIN